MPDRLTPSDFHAARREFGLRGTPAEKPEEIKRWQRALGVTADGIPGRLTYAALNEHAPPGYGPSTPEPEPERPTEPETDAPLVIIPRADWGAQHFKGRTKPLGRVQAVSVHHTASPTFPKTRAEGGDEVRATQRFHQQNRGWADVGYHLLLSQDGTFFQGRAQHDANPDPLSGLALGSHVGNRNTGNIGVCVMGFFHAPHAHRMSPAATAALARMLKTLCARYGLTGAQIRGHREWPGAVTACPGDTLMPLVRSIREGIR